MLKFAIKMEEELIGQIENLDKNYNLGLGELFGLLLKFEREFLDLLKAADRTDIDLGSYPQVDAGKFFGEDNTLIQTIKMKSLEPQQTICALWMLYALIEKSAQYYAQASLNNSHPVAKLFMRSLSEAKGILRGRLAACVRITYNDIWEEVGFAPFVLGKD